MPSARQSPPPLAGRARMVWAAPGQGGRLRAGPALARLLAFFGVRGVGVRGLAESQKYGPATPR